MAELKTRWSRLVTPENVWKEYPRPDFARPNWKNLNGLWEYAITEDEKVPKAFQGLILVPFSPEAPLSGVGKRLKPEEWLWYRRCFGKEELSVGEKDRLLLHFGAVDQSCCVYVDGQKAGSHVGGYLPFTLDITELIKGKSGEHELLVKVRDISDTGWHSRGKQKLASGGMYYTAQSGIWQTVWLEVVPDQYLRHVRIRPDYDRGSVFVRAVTGKREPVSMTVFEAFDEECLDAFLNGNFSVTIPDHDIVISRRAVTGRETELPIQGFKSWSPEDPFLYGLLLETEKDRVLCYFAMRTCTVEKDETGNAGLYLNHKPYFQTGLLDQGYWPDGLYTAPCDEALIFDVQSAKAMGYRMLRKHVKVETARWYYHCDRLGMLVWQDMVNGGSAYQDWFVTYLATAFSYLKISVKDSHRRLLSRREREGRNQFRRELRDMIKTLYNHPSIVCWVPFNEGWGQFDAEKITEEIRRMDNTRLIDQASGWYDQKGGDIQSIHSYFLPFTFRKEDRAAVLTEYGGYSLRVDGHCQSEKIYGYKTFDKSEDFCRGVEKLLEQTVFPQIRKGLCGAVYTQLSDVEEEVNGLLTYDRLVQKVPAEWMRQLNRRMISLAEEK